MAPPLDAFGAPRFDLTREDLLRPGTVFQIGVAPSRIDILTSISGVSFEHAWPNRTTVSIGSLSVPVLGKDDFIANKRATGRPRDQIDLDLLEETERER